MAYTNPNHCLRTNISRICPHSNHVTAAACLQRTKAINDEIAFKLHWHPILKFARIFLLCSYDYNELL
jgi:hypothetical protein